MFTGKVLFAINNNVVLSRTLLTRYVLRYLTVRPLLNLTLILSKILYATNLTNVNSLCQQNGIPRRRISILKTLLLKKSGTIDIHTTKP